MGFTFLENHGAMSKKEFRAYIMEYRSAKIAQDSIEEYVNFLIEEDTRDVKKPHLFDELIQFLPTGIMYVPIIEVTDNEKGEIQVKDGAFLIRKALGSENEMFLYNDYERVSLNLGQNFVMAVLDENERVTIVINPSDTSNGSNIIKLGRVLWCPDDLYYIVVDQELSIPQKLRINYPTDSPFPDWRGSYYGL